MTTDWIDVGALDEHSPGTPKLCKAGGERVVCVRLGDEVHALEDRCPHQGYPLSQGTVAGSVLTCQWHNWKFELSTGECTFGGDAAHRYPTRIEAGRVLLRLARDPAVEVPRLTAGLRAAMLENDLSRALREGLRLSAVAGAGEGELGAALAVLARDGAERAPYGFDHGLALLADACSWIEQGLVPAAEMFVVAANVIGEPNLMRPRRPIPDAIAPDRDLSDPSALATDLTAERRGDAEHRVRRLVRERGVLAAAEALLPFLANHLYDYGHGAIFLSKALELATRFPAAAEEILAASTVQLGWATADTSLPPFTATRTALGELARAVPRRTGAGFDRAAYEAAVLESERAAVEATMKRLAEGCAPVELLRATARSAAVRLSRFDPGWERSLEAEVGVLDVTHAVTFAEAAIVLGALGDAGASAAPRLALQAAGFVGKLRRADVGPSGQRSSDASAPAGATAHVDLATAVASRDVGSALALLPTLDRGARLSAYRSLAPFVAMDAAVRAIRVAHTVKTCEALHRLDAADPDGGDTYLRAAVAYVTPRRPERDPRRIATVARAFLRDGRPPEGLY